LSYSLLYCKHELLHDSVILMKTNFAYKDTIRMNFVSLADLFVCLSPQFSMNFKTFYISNVYFNF
jgi:hypothetical protein